MKLKPLTDQQKRVLEFIEAYQGDNGYPPTFKEIGDAVGLANITAVRGHLMALEKKGYIVKTPDKARSIKIVHSPSRLSRLKRRMHEVLRTNEGVYHQVVYGLAWTTWQRKPCLDGTLKGIVEDVIDRETVERGWSLIERRIEKDHIVVIVKTWPNHSPDQTVKRFQSACRAARQKRPEDFPEYPLWGKGYVVATSLELMDDLVGRLFENQPVK